MSRKLNIFIWSNSDFSIGKTKKPRLAWLLEDINLFNYFLGLPSPRIIQRAVKGVESSSLNAYLASTYFIDPANHWFTTLRDAPHKLPNSVWLFMLSVSIMCLTRSAVVFTGYRSNVWDG